MDVTDVAMRDNMPEDAPSGPSHLVASFRGRENEATWAIGLRVPEDKKGNRGASGDEGRGRREGGRREEAEGESEGKGKA